MKKYLIVLIGFMAIWGFSRSPSAYGWEFNLIPMDGVVFGAPGETIGWGYEIINDTAYYLEAWGFDPGSFDDTLIIENSLQVFDIPTIILPGATYQVIYSKNAQGLFEFAWAPTVTESDAIPGLFYLSISFWDDDPLINNNANIIDFDGGIASYSAGVSGISVPEPNSLWLLLAGILSGFLLSLKISNYKFYRRK